MATKSELFLHEEIMLLALRDREGTVASGTHYQYAIGGAILAELLLQGRISVEQSKKKMYAKVIDSTPVGESLLDNCLAKITGAKKTAQLQTWVSRFAGVKNLKKRVAGQLCRRGILRMDEDKVLGLFTRKVYPEVDPGPERQLIAGLHNAIFSEGGEVDPRTVVLLSLANSADLLKLVFDKKELRGRKKRIEQVINGEMTGQAAKEAIQAMQAAVMVACIMPAVFAATSASR
jgi:Golgi phosphoprotein 3